MCLRHTQTLLDLCRSLGWVVNMDKSELVPQQSFDFVGYHFNLSQKIYLLLGLETCLVRQFMSLISLLTATEKQVVSVRLHETHPMAPEEALACPRTSGEDHSHSLISPCSSKVVVEPKQCPIRSTFTPVTARPPTVYRRIKRRLGRTLKEITWQKASGQGQKAPYT